MINKIFVLEQEYHLLEQKLGEGEQIKQEIAELGKEANLQ